jgi:hypothetical protein
MKILVKFPTRSRPARFFRSLASVFDNAYDPDNIFVLVTADTDDQSMNNNAVKRELMQYYNRNICLIYGQSKSKVDAINRDMDKVAKDFPAAADWNILVVLSDDMRMITMGWDEIIRVEMQRNFPQGDGYLHFEEKDTKAALNVMEIMDRRFYDRFGFIYHPSYKSLFCDNEKMELAKMFGRYVYINFQIFVHENPAYGYLPRDEMFNEQQNLWGEDEENYRLRKAMKFEAHKWTLKDDAHD